MQHAAGPENTTSSSSQYQTSSSSSKGLDDDALEFASIKAGGQQQGRPKDRRNIDGSKAEATREEQDAAATLLQSTHRGSQTRKEMQKNIRVNPGGGTPDPKKFQVTNLKSSFGFDVDAATNQLATTT